jgi:hypothetical protein
MYSNSHALLALVLIPLIAWRLYSRFRRLVGRQKLSRVRPWVTLVIFPLLLLALALAAARNPLALGALVGAVVIGALLGIYGLRHTRFEATAEGWFYTPNAHLGIALSLLFFARIAYRFIVVGALGLNSPDALHGISGSPLTLGVFGVLAGYYVCYAIGLLRWRLSAPAKPASKPNADPAA